MNKEIKKKYRAKELALYIGVGLSTIWLYIKQGKLSTTKVSAKVTVLDTNELELFFNGDRI